MPSNSKWLKPENEQKLRVAARNNHSVAGMCRELGLKPRGGNIGTLRHHIVRLNIDTSHHTGQLWNKGKYENADPRHNKQTIRRRLLRECNNTCSSCGLTEWMGEQIPLEVDHVDGDNSNNEDYNLRILCCNCHAQTPTFRNKKRKPVSD